LEDAYKGVHSAENTRAFCEANYSVDAAETLLSDPTVAGAVAFRTRSALDLHLVKHQLGKALFDDFIQCVRNAGGPWIWLSVLDLNHRAKSFCRKLAFAQLGTGPVFEIGSDQLMSTIMAREI